MTKKSRELRPRFKLWLSTSESEGVFGDGKWRLLEAIERDGSLKAASVSLGISYRKAWGDITKAEKTLGIVLVEKHHGGRAGGSARLTTAGKKWLQSYTRFRSKIEKAAEAAYHKHIAEL